ncbi:MAG TPA: hypothetical protein P5218_13065, partial [Planctomycetota bacterium]|nr:hypothetical protein [Planctomycetota bacterium]
MIPSQALALVFACATLSPQESQPAAAPSKTAPGEAAPASDAQHPTVEQAVTEGIRLLLENQESYRTDKPVGSLSEDKLAEWQKDEAERLAKLRQRGAESKKRPNREWPYEGVYRVGPLGAIPSGYRVGGTAIVCEALLRAPGFSEDPQRKAALQRSVAFLLEMFANDPTLEGQAQTDYDVRGWGHAYGLNLLLDVSENGLVDAETVEQCKAVIPDLIGRLQAGALQGGGWNYAGGACSPFMTGPTLLFLFQARAAGYEVPETMVQQALDALEAGRDESSGAFGYAGPRREPMASSAARAAIAELALMQAGRSDTQHLRRAVLGFFDNWEHLLARKSQQGTHKPPYGIAPYYFFYGHAYAGLAIESLPEPERPALRQRLQQLLWDTRQANGGWNDRIFPRTESYSTAMSVLALLSPSLPAPARWTGAGATKPAPEA